MPATEAIAAFAFAFGNNHHARRLVGRFGTGVGFSGRPFPILGITVLGEVAAEPLHLANRSFLQLEWTPLYTGVASPLNARLLPIHQSRLPSPRLPSFSRRRFRAATTGSPFAAVYSLYEASWLRRLILEPPEGAALRAAPPDRPPTRQRKSAHAHPRG
jgi:hypothetical protein